MILERGYHVFAEHVLGGQFFRSKLIRVGTVAYEPGDVIEMADRIRARAA